MKQFPLGAYLILMASCLKVGSNGPPEPIALETSAVPLNGSFSLAMAEGGLTLVYPDRDTLSLVMSSFRENPQLGLTVDRSWYLDRISDAPELDALSGAHLYMQYGRYQHLFYMDRFPEGNRLLKHLIKKPDLDTPSIDVLPFQGKPVSILMDGGAGSEIFLERDEALYRQPIGATSSPRLVRQPFVSAGTIITVNAASFQGFTVFDLASRQLLLFRRRADSIEQKVVHGSGQVHYSALSDSGELQVLIYEPESTRLLLLQERPSGAGFSIQPVTLARQTHALAFFAHRQRLFFLFDEAVIQNKRLARYQLSLLVPARVKSGGRYVKISLQSASSPFCSFKALQNGSRLYIAFFQETLKLLLVDLDQLGADANPQ